MNGKVFTLQKLLWGKFIKNKIKLKNTVYTNLTPFRSPVCLIRANPAANIDTAEVAINLVAPDRNRVKGHLKSYLVFPLTPLRIICIYQSNPKFRVVYIVIVETCKITHTDTYNINKKNQNKTLLTAADSFQIHLVQRKIEINLQVCRERANTVLLTT